MCVGFRDIYVHDWRGGGMEFHVHHWHLTKWSSWFYQLPRYGIFVHKIETETVEAKSCGEIWHFERITPCTFCSVHRGKRENRRWRCPYVARTQGSLTDHSCPPQRSTPSFLPDNLFSTSLLIPLSFFILSVRQSSFDSSWLLINSELQISCCLTPNNSQISCRFALPPCLPHQWELPQSPSFLTKFAHASFWDLYPGNFSISFQTSFSSQPKFYHAP